MPLKGRNCSQEKVYFSIFIFTGLEQKAWFSLVAGQIVLI